MLQYELRTGVIINLLDHIESTLATPTALLADLGEYVVQSTQERFRTSTAPDGSRWQANSENTYLSILGSQHTGNDGLLNNRGINRVASKRPLVGDGTLMRDIHYQISGNLLLVGSNLIYSATHQFGATIKPKNGKSLSWKIGNVSVFAKQVVIPARPYLGISVADEVEMVAIIQDHLLP